MLTPLPNGYAAVIVPEGMTRWGIFGSDDEDYELGDPDILAFLGDPGYYKNIELPPGSWSIIGLAKELSEEDWREIVANNGFGCYDNYEGILDNKYTLLTATESGLSLLASLSLPNNCLILKKK